MIDFELNKYICLCLLLRFGEWSRAGCHTELPLGEWWKQNSKSRRHKEEDVSSSSPILVNCTCNHLSSFAVLVDLVGDEVLCILLIIVYVSILNLIFRGFKFFLKYIVPFEFVTSQLNNEPIKKSLYTVYLKQKKHFIKNISN